MIERHQVLKKGIGRILKMIDTPESLVFRMLRKINRQLFDADEKQIQQFIMGVNGVVLRRGKNVIDFSKNDMVFPYAFAMSMNRLETDLEKEWFDVDYYQSASFTGGGIDSTLKSLFEAEGYSVKSPEGEEIESWPSIFSFEEEE